MITSKLGLLLAGTYLVLCVWLIATQGLFGESFIALILGLPLSLVFVSFEYGNVSGPFLYVLILLPIVLNAFALYWIGTLVSRKKA